MSTVCSNPEPHDRHVWAIEPNPGEDGPDMFLCVGVQGARQKWVGVGALPGRCFQLFRRKDPSGVSGIGVVANGVQWPDGTVSMRWLGDDGAFANWDSIEAVERVHGHGGLTVVEWVD